MVSFGWSTLDHLRDRLIELLNIKMTVVVMVVELNDRRKIADAKAAVHDLGGQLTIGGRLVAADTVTGLKLVDQALAATDVAGSSVAEQHEVVAGWSRSEVGVEGQQPEDAVGSRAEVFGDDLGCIVWDPAQQMLDILAGTQDELLRLLVITVLIACPHQFANLFKILLARLHHLGQTERPFRSLPMHMPLEGVNA
jgi:hypothetical protein